MRPALRPLLDVIVGSFIKLGWEVPFPPRSPDRNLTNPRLLTTVRVRREGETLNNDKSLWRAGPVLVDQLSTAAVQDEPESQGDQDRVVELTRNRDEVGDQVDRQRQVAEHQDERELAESRHAIVDEESPEEDEAIGNEARHRSCLTSTADDEQGEDDARVENEKCSKRDKGQLRNRHPYNVAPRPGPALRGSP